MKKSDLIYSVVMLLMVHSVLLVGALEACDDLFVRGDANDDGAVDLADGVFILNYLFLDDTAPVCIDAADTNDDEKIELTDAVYLFTFLFQGGLEIPGPFLEAGYDEVKHERSESESCNRVDDDNDGLVDEGEMCVPCDELPAVTWEKIFEKRIDRGIRYAIPADDCGYIAVGYSNSRIYIMKTDYLGNLKWEDDYGFSPSIASSIQKTEDGGYIIAASEFLRANYHIQKIDWGGNTEWERHFGNPDSDDRPEFAMQTEDGGYIIVGDGVPEGGGNQQAYVVKTASNGRLERETYYGGEILSRANSVYQTTDGEFIIAGDQLIDGFTRAWIFKIDSNGFLKWEKNYGGGIESKAGAIIGTKDNNYIFVGSNGDKVYVVKVNDDGDIILEKEYGDDSLFSYRGYSIRNTDDDGYIIIAGGLKRGTGDSDIYLTKIDADGEEEWFSIFDQSRNDNARSVEQTPDGGYIIGGSTDRYRELSVEDDPYIFKTDSRGNV
jgi:hypothetical protein